MQVLIDRGAAIDGPRVAGRSDSLVDGCLANGRAAAAEYLAAHGARLDLAGAAGLGRIDRVAGFFDAGGALTPPATVEQLRAGMNWACEHARTAVVKFLLDRGVLAMVPHQPNRPTFLHSAALGGHAVIVGLLLERGVPVDALETTYNGTPLNWALHGWSHAAAAARDRYVEVVARLVRAGAAINPAWLDDNAEPTLFARQLRAESRMLAAVRGEL